MVIDYELMEQDKKYLAELKAIVPSRLGTKYKIIANNYGRKDYLFNSLAELIFFDTKKAIPGSRAFLLGNEGTSEYYVLSFDREWILNGQEQHTLQNLLNGSPMNWVKPYSDLYVSNSEGLNIKEAFLKEILISIEDLETQLANEKNYEIQA